MIEDSIESQDRLWSILNKIDIYYYRARLGQIGIGRYALTLLHILQIGH